VRTARKRLRTWREVLMITVPDSMMLLASAGSCCAHECARRPLRTERMDWDSPMCTSSTP
jgi:hypothetical protein